MTDAWIGWVVFIVPSPYFWVPKLRELVISSALVQNPTHLNHLPSLSGFIGLSPHGHLIRVSPSRNLVPGCTFSCRLLESLVLNGYMWTSMSCPCHDELGTLFIGVPLVSKRHNFRHLAHKFRWFVSVPKEQGEQWSKLLCLVGRWHRLNLHPKAHQGRWNKTIEKPLWSKQYRDKSRCQLAYLACFTLR